MISFLFPFYTFFNTFPFSRVDGRISIVHSIFRSAQKLAKISSIKMVRNRSPRKDRSCCCTSCSTT